MQHRDIALAPLLSGGFNAARGPSKFFDYTRMVAVGIYSNVEPYRGFIRHDVDGILLDNDRDAWVEAIISLVSDEAKRKGLIAGAQNRISAWEKSRGSEG